MWLAATASNLGDGIFLTALPLLAVTLTRDPLALSTVTFGLTVPWLAFALLSGALVDRWDRIKVMRRVDALRCVLTASLAVVIVTGATSIPVLVGYALALGTVETLFDSASLSVIPTVVGPDPERLTRANARLEGASIVANGFAGPPAGAGLFAAAPALPAIANAVSFLASAVLLRRVPTRHVAADVSRSTLRKEIGVGLRWLWTQPVLTTLAAVVGVLNLATAAAPALLVLILQDEAGAGTSAYAVVLTISTGGALAGSVLAERFAARAQPRHALPLAVGCFAAGLLLVGAAPNVVVITVAFALIGLAGAAWNVVTVSMRQQLIPSELLGRVNSVYRLVAYGTMPLGALGGGALARAAGLRTPFLTAGLIVAVTIPVLIQTLHGLDTTPPGPGPITPTP